MIVSQALALALKKLKIHNINLPRLEAEILLSGILNKPREFLIAHPETILAKARLLCFRRRLLRRLKGEPIAYLTGHKEFYGLNFKVNKHVLIPRPETELMVDEALKLITNAKKPATVIDVGTGSGCVIISVAKKLNHGSGSISHYLIAADISPEALSIAKQNARKHQVNKKIKFIVSDLLAGIPKSKIENLKSKIFLANLPYGWKEWKNNCSPDAAGLKYEPKIALFTGQRGLELYKKLFRQIQTLAKKNYGRNDIAVLCEFDPRQTALMKKLVKKYFPKAKWKIKKDLSGLNRLVIIYIKKQQRANIVRPL